MLAAGLLAKKAVERGLKVKPWVKTSLAPGSKVVADYYREAGLMTYLEELNFHLVGFGCTTCIGNSGPLPEAVTQAVQKDNLVVAAVLSGNRNFEGRINPLVKANYLASPPLVVAYALAGTHRYRSDRRSARRGLRRPAGLPARHLADQRRGGSHGARGHQPRHVRTRIRARLRWRPELAEPCRFPRAVSTSGTRPPPTSRSRRTSTTWWTPTRRCRISTRCACWRCWAIRSPPITFRPPAPSPRTARRENI